MGCLATLILLCSCSVWEAFFKGVMVQEYLELVRYVLENGAKKTDRTGDRHIASLLASKPF